jgi:glycogen synthase
LWDPAKNVELLNRIAPRLSRQVLAAGPACQPGGQPERFRNLTLLGELGSGKLAHWMGLAPVYATPARYEPFGLTALEAALCGCALVLCDIPSLREVWADDAQYAAPDDEREWVRALNRLMAEPADILAGAARARRRAALYTPERMAAAYLELYAELRAARDGLLAGAAKEAPWFVPA